MAVAVASVAVTRGGGGGGGSSVPLRWARLGYPRGRLAGRGGKHYGKPVGCRLSTAGGDTPRETPGVEPSAEAPSHRHRHRHRRRRRASRAARHASPPPPPALRTASVGGAQRVTRDVQRVAGASGNP